MANLILAGTAVVCALILLATALALLQLYQKQQRPFAVAALIVRQDGKVLGVSRKDDPEHMGLVGGKLEPMEDEIIGLAREVYEETGLWIRNPVELLRGPGTSGHFMATYLVTSFTGEAAQKEAGKVEWMTLDELVARSKRFQEYNTKVAAEVRKTMAL